MFRQVLKRGDFAGISGGLRDLGFFRDRGLRFVDQIEKLVNVELLPSRSRSANRTLGFTCFPSTMAVTLLKIGARMERISAIFVLAAPRNISSFSDGVDRFSQIFDAIAKHLKLLHVIREEIFRLELAHHFEEIGFWKASRVRRFRRASCGRCF